MFFTDDIIDTIKGGLKIPDKQERYSVILACLTQTGLSGIFNLLSD